MEILPRIAIFPCPPDILQPNVQNFSAKLPRWFSNKKVFPCYLGRKHSQQLTHSYKGSRALSFLQKYFFFQSLLKVVVPYNETGNQAQSWFRVFNYAPCVLRFFSEIKFLAQTNNKGQFSWEAATLATVCN